MKTGEIMQKKGSVICRLPDSRGWGRFKEPVKIICSHKIDQIEPALAELESQLERGYYAAGFISYEAGAAFDRAFPEKDSSGFPLLWFGIYGKAPEIYDFGKNSREIFAKVGELAPELSEKEYNEATSHILKDIEDGNIYQANFTFRLKGKNTADPWHLFKALYQKHPVPYAAFINTGDFQIVSLSPELFLEKKGKALLSSPMKGTIKRDKNPEKDKANAEFLAKDPKNTAENLMIVDMVRNDMGRVCNPDSISVDPLFKVDKYNTLHQMISTVHGEVDSKTSFTDIMKATFPAASITGAPKIAAMQRINRLEKSPRKIYTGSIGCIYPDQDFCMNVAIRTLICDGDSTELGVGGGIVYDSKQNAELEEAILKSRFINAAEADFEILETMLYVPKNGIADLEKHLKRMQESARYFAFKYDYEYAYGFVNKQLETVDVLSRIRLLLNMDGVLKMETYELKHKGWGVEKARIKISSKHVSKDDIFLTHKTTRREFYNDNFRKALKEGYDEVIFFNELGQLCEGAISNIFIKQKSGDWYTPSLDCGLLPGIWREETIKELNAIEKVLYRKDLENADKILIGNSVRGAVCAGLLVV
jgi:para-aminobenzoate synthetase/4-amino-4-deoxychorismate lyase